MIPACTILILGICLFGLWWERNALQVTDTTITTDKITGDLELCVIADLHNKSFGKDNEKLFRKLSEFPVDAFLIPGDIITDGDSGNRPGLDFIKELGKLGKPVYYSLGNHEYRFRITHPEEYDAMVKLYEDSGVTYLDNRSVTGPKGTVISGISIPLENYQKFCPTVPFPLSQMTELLPKPEDTNRFQILLGHNPVYFETFRKWGADLTVAGHMHGGLVRIPGLGAVISPQFKLFPKYSAGLFREDRSMLYVSRGLGTHTVNIRIFNRPEIARIHLKKQ